MPRAIWKGAITFGLVNVPVAMVTATRSHDIRMHLVHDKDGSRLRQQRISAADGSVVEWEHVDRGVERDDGSFVRITDEELEALAAEKSRSMEIEDVVPLEQIDPMYVEKSWYLIPTEGGQRGYALLVSALAGTGRAAIAQLTMRGRQQLVAVRSTGDALVVEALRYADEVVEPEAVLDDDAIPEASAKEVKMAKAFLESLEVEFDPDRYHDEYQQQLSKLIERKAEAGDVVIQPEEATSPKTTPVDDIMAALEASLAKTRSSSKSGSGSKSRSKPKAKAKAKA